MLSIHLGFLKMNKKFTVFAPFTKNGVLDLAALLFYALLPTEVKRKKVSHETIYKSYKNKCFT